MTGRQLGKGFRRGAGHVAPDAVNGSRVIAKEEKQSLLLFNGHRYLLNRPGHPGQQDQRYGNDQDNHLFHASTCSHPAGYASGE